MSYALSLTNLMAYKSEHTEKNTKHKNIQNIHQISPFLLISSSTDVEQ